MENRVSPYEERQLANAIERAATVASVNESLDRNELLVSQLKKASVDPKFAKTASQAFNKRLTVLTFKKTADEHKADSFELSDPDTVYSMMTGAEVKTASAKFRMGIESLTNGGMEKAACKMPNVIVRDKRFEHLCSWDTFKQRLESDMEKLASAFRDIQADLMRRENSIADQAEEVAKYFKNASYNFDFTTAVNLYGDKLKEAIGDLVDKGVSFQKTASYVIRPSKDIFKKVANLIEARETYDNIKWFAQEFATGLAEFAKSAAALGDEYQAKEAALQDEIDQAQNTVSGLNTRIQAMKDQLDEDTRSGLLGARLGGAANILIGTGAGLGEGAIGAVNDISGAARTALNNAKALYYAGNNVSISPGDLLDAAFLTKDRYRDRLLAWSDMSADPQLAMYPAEQVFAATQKAMDMDTSMERPDQREVLRAQVAQLLAQNNRVSTADIAALATTLKALSASRGNASAEAAKAVSALSDKTEPGLVNQEAIVGQFGDTQGLKDLRGEAQKGLEESYKQIEAIGERERERRKDELKDITKERDTAANALQRFIEMKYTQEHENALRTGSAEQRDKDRQLEQDKLTESGRQFDASLAQQQQQWADYVQAYKDWLANNGGGGNTPPPNPPGPAPQPTPPTPGPGSGGNGGTKEPKQPKQPFTPEVAATHYPDEASRQEWFNKQQDWIDRNGITFNQYVQDMASSSPNAKTNGNFWLLEQLGDTEFTFASGSGGVVTVTAADILNAAQAINGSQP